MYRKLFFALLAAAISLTTSARGEGAFPEFVDPHPESDHAAFGTHVVPLSNGNVVITAPGDDFGGPNAGAIHLFHGGSGRLISTITGSRRDDRAGSGGVLALPSGNFVILSPDWNSETLDDVGAATWVNGLTGISGSISAENSLVGTYENDRVGNGGATTVGNGNYVVVSGEARGINDGHGAITWCHGAAGLAGPVSAVNSLIGSRPGERVGAWTSWQSSILVLPNGNYLSFTYNTEGGAVTWAKGDEGIRGTVSPANSLTGTGSYSAVPSSNKDVTVLANGNYVVHSTGWDRGSTIDAGATTWGSAEYGISGEISAGNSLLGTTGYGPKRFSAVTALPNGHYLVRSGTGLTWCDGTTGRAGDITAGNSLTGHEGLITVLPGGNFLIVKADATIGGKAYAGSVTWVDGSRECLGAFNPANSLTGGQSGDFIGSRVVVLANGNYVILGSGRFTSTWGNGATGVRGVVSQSNSLFCHAPDVGIHEAYPLANGHYVVVSSGYRRDLNRLQVGAATWCNGTRGRTGNVDPDNSLTGARTGDQVGHAGVLPLADGNYVVLSSGWQQENIQKGAATWCRGDRETEDVVDDDNSLIGTSPGDGIGISGVALANGSYLVLWPGWDLAASKDHGAVTWCPADTRQNEEVGLANSLVGMQGQMLGHRSAFDPGPVQILADGDYVVRGPSPAPGFQTPGSLTWGSKNAGASGAVSPGNSIIGPFENSRLGTLEVIPLPDGGFISSAYADPCVVWGDGNGAGANYAVPGNSLMSPPDVRGTMTAIVDPVNRSYYASQYMESGNGKVKVGSFATGGRSMPEIAVELDPGAPITSASTVVDFGHVLSGQSTTKTLRIFNRGNWPLEIGTITSVPSTGLAPFSLNVAGMKKPLISGQSTTFTVRFAPPPNGISPRTLSIPSSDAVSPEFRVKLLGIASSANPNGVNMSAWNTGTLIMPVSRLFGDKISTTGDDGNPLSVVTTSAAGGTATIAGDHIHYTPPAGAGTDTFTITVRRADGSAVTAKANITIIPSPPPLNGRSHFIAKYPDNRAGVQLRALPYQRRTIEVSGDMTSWRRMGTAIADSSGTISFIDDASPEFKGFYRLAPP